MTVLTFNLPTPSVRHRTRRVLTARQAAEIKHLAGTTDLFQHQIAAVVGVNQGRVSEVLSGKRFPEILPASH